jgi:hypothetical protein
MNWKSLHRKCPSSQSKRKAKLKKRKRFRVLCVEGECGATECPRTKIIKNAGALRLVNHTTTKSTTVPRYGAQLVEKCERVQLCDGIREASFV